MKFLLLFLVIFMLPAYYFGSEEVQTLHTNQAISQAPGFTNAVVDEVVKLEGQKKAIA